MELSKGDRVSYTRVEFGIHRALGTVLTVSPSGVFATVRFDDGAGRTVETAHLTKEG